MSSASHYVHMEEPLAISSAREDEGEDSSTSTSTGASSSPSAAVRAHLKLNSRRYALVLVLVFIFAIGVAIGGAAFPSSGSSVVYVDASTGGGGAQPAPPISPSGGQPMFSSAAAPTGGAPSGGPPSGGRSGGPGPIGPTGVPGPDSGVTAAPVTGSCINGSRVGLEEGPFFVDEKILSSDLYVTSPGVPVTLTFTVYNTSAVQCVPLSNAWLDIWEADWHGKYSDEASEGTKGSTYLRGYQITDKAGAVTFKTTYVRSAADSAAPLSIARYQPNALTRCSVLCCAEDSPGGTTVGRRIST